MSCVTIPFVSRPEASPLSWIPAMSTSVERRARDHVERLRGRDGPQDVAVQVADLHDDAVGLVVMREVELALLIAQLLETLAGGRHLVQEAFRRLAGNDVRAVAGV